MVIFITFASSRIIPVPSERIIFVCDVNDTIRFNDICTICAMVGVFAFAIFAAASDAAASVSKVIVLAIGSITQNS